MRRRFILHHVYDSATVICSGGVAQLTFSTLTLTQLILILIPLTVQLLTLTQLVPCAHIVPSYTYGFLFSVCLPTF